MSGNPRDQLYKLQMALQNRRGGFGGGFGGGNPRAGMGLATLLLTGLGVYAVSNSLFNGELIIVHNGWKYCFY